MILSRHDIEREIARLDWPSDPLVIDPLPAPDSKAWQPASIDLTLAREFLFYPLSRPVAIDPREDASSLLMSTTAVRDPRNPDSPELFRLEPGDFVLASTVERVRIPRRLVGRLEGRSSLGRLGIVVHVTAGYIDPGFEGRITLEIANLNPNPVLLVPGMRIAQLSLLRMQTPCTEATAYQGKYQGQNEVTGSRIERDFATPRRGCGPGCRCGMDRGCPGRRAE